MKLILPAEWPFVREHSPPLDGRHNVGCGVRNCFLTDVKQFNLVDSFADQIRKELSNSSFQFDSSSICFDDASPPIFDDTASPFFDDWYNDIEEDPHHTTERNPRTPNRFPYEFGRVEKSNWYNKFLKPEIRERTYIESQSRFSTFRSLFRVPLTKVDALVDMFLSKGWIHATHHCRDNTILKIKAELLILSCLNVLGTAAPMRTLKSNTNICTEDHRQFFHLFIDKMYSIRSEHIFYPRTMDALKKVVDEYEREGLPGAGGSIDVVHCKWSNCPAGDKNRCKGKESYPSLAWEVITGHSGEIFGISSVQFGTRNDKHIVKLDNTVSLIRDGWYR